MNFGIKLELNNCLNTESGKVSIEAPTVKYLQELGFSVPDSLVIVKNCILETQKILFNNKFKLVGDTKGKNTLNLNKYGDDIGNKIKKTT